MIKRRTAHRRRSRLVLRSDHKVSSRRGAPDCRIRGLIFVHWGDRRTRLGSTLTTNRSTEVIESVPTAPEGWDGEEPLSAAQAIGDAWCDERRSPALLVPSAVTPGEYNLIVSSRHPGWRWDWVVSGPQSFAFDARLAQLRQSGHRNEAVSFQSAANQALSVLFRMGRSDAQR